MAGITAQVALLSTGDELVSGDVINTNSQAIAKRLFENFIQPGVHLTTGDDQADIEKAIQFLLTGHKALIITGGLGPTSDDRTRFALAAVTHTDLVFNEPCWQWVIERLNRLSLPIPDTNRQQCLFPSEAVIFHNANGTAAACQLTLKDHIIFMLPGPPFECLPIFEREILPYLLSHGFSQPVFRCQWLLLGVSEGMIAEKLDPIAANTDCIVGYRINQPYLEVKLLSSDPLIFAEAQAQFEILIGNKSISSAKQKASEQLQLWVKEKQTIIQIDDEATGGLLAYTLLNPDTYPFFNFSQQATSESAIRVNLSGLKPFWRKQKDSNTLEITIRFQENGHQAILTIPDRKERTPLFAMELACWELLCYLRNKVEGNFEL